MSKVLDTRDLQKRLDDLETEKQDFIDNARAEHEESGSEDDFVEDDYAKDWAEENSDEAQELEELKSMSDEIPEWRHGETLIREDYWEEYVEEMLKDCGDLPQDIPHYIVIDWKATADNIAADYSTLEYQGDSYYYRNC